MCVGAALQAAGLTNRPSPSTACLLASARFAPIYSGSGYGSEALSFINALLHTHSLRGEDLWVTHSGDAVTPAAVRGMEPATRTLLERQVWGLRGGWQVCMLREPVAQVTASSAQAGATFCTRGCRNLCRNLQACPKAAS